MDPETRHRVLAVLGVLEDRERDDHFLHKYWTQTPEGLAKWVKSRTPWKALVRHLAKHVGLDRAEAMAAKWHVEVLGYRPGQKPKAAPSKPKPAPKRKPRSRLREAS